MSLDPLERWVCGLWLGLGVLAIAGQTVGAVGVTLR
jgi:hypothetical protein